jgi:hypothetical protein
MSKYNGLKILIKRKAKTNHICSLCNAIIKNNNFYYSEELSDKRINYLHMKKLCIICYKKYAGTKRKNN